MTTRTLIADGIILLTSCGNLQELIQRFSSFTDEAKVDCSDIFQFYPFGNYGAISESGVDMTSKCPPGMQHRMAEANTIRIFPQKAQ